MFSRDPFKSKKRLFFFIFYLIILNISTLWAREPTEIPEVIVFEQRGARKIIKQSVSATQIPLVHYQHRMMSISEVLSQQTGVHLTRYGGLEEATSISIRGSASDEVTVLLDGIPLNTAQGGGVDLSLFHLEGLEQMDVYRGSFPLLGTAGASAGVVSLTSRQIQKGIQARVSIGYGSFSTWQGNASFSKSFKNWGLIFSHALTRTEGDFSFLDDNGTPFNLLDDEVTKRQNNASQTIHPFLKLYYDFDSKTHLDFVTHLIRKDNGVPGISTNQSQAASQDHTEYLMNLGFRRFPIFLDSLLFETNTYFRWVKDQYSDLQAEIGLGGAQDNDDDTTLFGQKISFTWIPSVHHEVQGVLGYQHERFSPENFLTTPTQGDPSSRHTITLGMGDEISLFSLVLSPHVGLDVALNHISGDDPSLGNLGGFLNSKNHEEISGGLGALFNVNSFLSLEGHLNRGIRFPTFPELFGDRGGVVGNPFLDPQKSLNGDVGVKITSKKKGWMGKGDLVATYFNRQVTDLIQFQQNAGFIRAENVGKAHIQGTEVSGHVQLFKFLDLSSAYTFQWAKDGGQNEGRFLPGRPQHELNGELAFSWKKLKTFVNANWMDANYLDPLNTRVVKDRIFMNSGVNYRINRFFEASFEAKNLTNQRIVDIVGFPLPGRSFYGKLVANWEGNKKTAPRQVAE